MTTTTGKVAKKSTPRKKLPEPTRRKTRTAASGKTLRIREELLPDSAVYGTFAGRDYVMIPVEDFADWYEDACDSAVAEYAHDDTMPSVPAELVHDNLRGGRKNHKS